MSSPAESRRRHVTAESSTVEKVDDDWIVHNSPRLKCGDPLEKGSMMGLAIGLTKKSRETVTRRFSGHHLFVNLFTNPTNDPFFSRVAPFQPRTVVDYSIVVYLLLLSQTSLSSSSFHNSLASLSFTQPLSFISALQPWTTVDDYVVACLFLYFAVELISSVNLS
ncbi:unnamed protein product [Arabidopsis halleri]